MSTSPLPQTPVTTSGRTSAAMSMSLETAVAQAEDVAHRLDALAQALEDAAVRGRLAFGSAHWTGVGRAELGARLEQHDRDTAAIADDIRAVAAGLRRP